MNSHEARAYQLGRNAWFHQSGTRQERERSCPYPIGSFGGSLRTNWFIGFLDARFEKKYEHIQESHTQESRMTLDEAR